METIKSCITKKTKLLKDNYVNVPKLEARLLLAKTFNKDLNWTYSNTEKKISTKKIRVYEKLIKQKINRIPTAYLLGNKEFYSMNFKVNRNTLIPRPETESMIDEIKKNFKKNKKFNILDLGTGSGCILLSILQEFKKSVGIGVDKYLKTINVAKTNSKKNYLSSRSKFITLDWNNPKFLKKILQANKNFTSRNKFQLIVSNPPYLLKNEMKSIMPEVKYEPYESLYDNKDGLSFYKMILPKIHSLISSNGYICFEINPKSSNKINKICKKNGFANFKFIKDLSKKKRFILIKN